MLELTNSATYLALDAFLGELPILLFTLIGGVVADRYDRRKLLLASQFIQMASAFALAALVFGGKVHIYHVLALSFMSGCAQAFGGPAYQSLIPSLVRKEHLPNAIALNSIQFNAAVTMKSSHRSDIRRHFGSDSKMTSQPARDVGGVSRSWCKRMSGERIARTNRCRPHLNGA